MKRLFMITEVQSKADAGDAEAQYELGKRYADGIGLTQNYTEAAKWYRMAAEQGHADAQFNLGASYINGDGVPQDYTEAAKWYRKAAEQGHEDAKDILDFRIELLILLPIEKIGKAPRIGGAFFVSMGRACDAIDAIDAKKCRRHEGGGEGGAGKNAVRHEIG